MTKLQKILLGIVAVITVMLLFAVANLSSKISAPAQATPDVGGVYNQVTKDFYQGISVNGTQIINSSGAWVGPGLSPISSTTGTFSSNVTVGGTLGITGNVSVNTSKFTVTASSGNTVSAGSILSNSASGGVGYATGAGCAVSQATDRTTGVTCTGVSGAITTQATSLAAGAEVTFTVTDTSVAVGDAVIVSVRSGPTTTGGTQAYVSTVAAGSFKITLTNNDGSTADTGAAILNFAVVKAVSA